MAFELGVYSFGNTPRLADGSRGPTAKRTLQVPQTPALLLVEIGVGDPTDSSCVLRHQAVSLTQPTTPARSSRGASQSDGVVIRGTGGDVACSSTGKGCEGALSRLRARHIAAGGDHLSREYGATVIRSIRGAYRDRSRTPGKVSEA